MPIPAADQLAQPQRNRLARFASVHCADIHCHCLPGVDDGPATMSESLSLCELLVNDGITRCVATPHQLGGYFSRNLAADVRRAVAALNDALLQRGIPLAILPGGDVRVDERIPSLLNDNKILTLGDTGKYLLLELPHEAFMDPLPLLKVLAGLNIIPIISHPERNRSLVARPSVVDSWLACGATLQITSGSFAGDFGETAQRAAWYWLETGAASIVASDAHDTIKRPPRMSRAIELISRRLGDDVARRTCIENPNRVLDGIDLLQQPAVGALVF